MTQNSNLPVMRSEAQLFEVIEEKGEMTPSLAAQVYFNSGLFTDIGGASQAMVKISIGQALGISPISSMMQVYLISTSRGIRIQLGADLLGGLIRKHPSYDYKVIDNTAEKATVEIVRLMPDQGESEQRVESLGKVTFTIEQAKKAGLVKERSPWVAYPARMLFTTALAHAQRIYAPDVSLFPVYTEGEAGVFEEIGQVSEVSLIEEKDGSHPISKKKLAKKVKAPEPVVAEAEIIEPVLTDELTTRMQDAVKVATKRLQDKESEWMHPTIRNSAGFAEIIRNEIAFVANKYNLVLSELEKQIMWKMPKPKANPKPKPMTVEEMQDKQREPEQETYGDTEDTSTFEKSATAKGTVWARLFNDFKTRKRITEAFLKKFNAGIIRKWREMGYHAEIKEIENKYLVMFRETAPWIVTNIIPADVIDEAPPVEKLQESKVENFPPQQESKPVPKIEASLFDANDVDLSDWGGDND